MAGNDHGELGEMIERCEAELASAEGRVDKMATALLDGERDVKESAELNQLRSEERVRRLERQVDELKHRVAGKDDELSRLRQELTRALQGSSDAEDQALARLRGAEDRVRELKGIVATTHANNQVLMAQLMSERRRRDDFWKSLEHRGTVAEETNSHLRDELSRLQRERKQDLLAIEKLKATVLGLWKKQGAAKEAAAKRDREISKHKAKREKEAATFSGRVEALEERNAALEAELERTKVELRSHVANEKHRARLRNEMAVRGHVEKGEKLRAEERDEQKRKAEKEIPGWS